MIEQSSSGSPDFPPDAFSRHDESDDAQFYSTKRFVDHLDRTAVATVERIVGTLVVEKDPVVLDLMAGSDSHLPQGIGTSRMVGLGLTRNELSANATLDEVVIHDLNKDPRLPFPDAVFDGVLNVISVDYMTRPVEVFRDVARILRPGGLFLVVFSNRMFPHKTVKIWLDSTEEERVALVEEFFSRSAAFEPPKQFVSLGKPRPRDDPYAGGGLPSDPVYAVYAEAPGRGPERPLRPTICLDEAPRFGPEEIEYRKKMVRHTLRCPYCDESMTRWELPDTPFKEWDADFVYVCFNHSCPYNVRSWGVMRDQGNHGFCYRLMYHPERDCFYTVPDIGFDAPDP